MRTGRRPGPTRSVREGVPGLHWVMFAVAGAPGAIHLGHTRSWVELRIVYSRRIPGLRAPILRQVDPLIAVLLGLYHGVSRAS